MGMDRMPQAGIRELFMRCLTISLLAIAVASSASAQQQANPNPWGWSNFFQRRFQSAYVEKIGKDDLIGITVYDAPELTRTVRVGSDGDIRLPMLRQHILAAGLYPAELENAITPRP
jgi:protein involved in polysaccharide export with SLBB domain